MMIINLNRTGDIITPIKQNQLLLCLCVYEENSLPISRVANLDKQVTETVFPNNLI